MQVAGTNYKLKASVDGETYVLQAFHPLPHTGEPVKVNSAEKQ